MKSVLLRTCIAGGLLAALTRAAPVEYQVAPNVTDTAIKTYLSPHYVYIDSAMVGRNRLFVFLPGSGGAPAFYSQICRQAASLGFHSIGLMYPNTPTVGLLCAQSRDSSCFENVRLEILYGQDVSSQVDINRANSLENRLIKLLLWLKSNHPLQGWDQYLDSRDSLVWSKIVLAGHSQGGGHAALLARDHAVARVVQFSSVADFSLRYTTPAFWITANHATPASRYFGFSHVQDSTVPWVQLQQNWRALGMDAFGKACADSTAPLYGNAHELYTRAPTAHPAVSLSYHDCTAVNNASTADGTGNSIFAPVWTYLLTAAENGVAAFPFAHRAPASVAAGKVSYFDLRGRALGAGAMHNGAHPVVVVSQRGAARIALRPLW